LKYKTYPSLLLTSLLLAACGGGSGGADSGTQATGASAQGAQVSQVEQAAAGSESESESSSVVAVDVESDSDLPPELTLAAAPDTDAVDMTDVAVANAGNTATETAAPEPAGQTTTLLGTTTTSLYHLYVSPTGSDSNSGTKAAPFKTILKASKVAKPGTTVHVAPGTYAGGFQTTTSGTASARIRYVSDTKWGAKIVPASGSTAGTGWSNRGSYVDIIGFEINGKDSAVWRNGLAATGSYNTIKGNRVHHVATGGTCTSQGGSGINTHNYYGGYHIDVLDNVVHNVGITGCKYIQGIYTSTSGKVKNNLVYSIGNWGIHLWHDARNLDISNNTIVKSGGGITVGGGGYYRLSAPADYVNVSNNIVYGNAKGIWQQGDNGTHNTYTNNLSYNNTRANFSVGSSAISGSVSSNPQFVDYTAGNYQLKSTSPAVNRGSTKYAPVADLIGTPRPQGSTVDLGAYEYKY